MVGMWERSTWDQLISLRSLERETRYSLGEDPLTRCSRSLLESLAESVEGLVDMVMLAGIECVSVRVVED